MRIKASQLVEDVPAWVEGGLTGSAIEAIQHGGCGSGAYMPAVIYHDASQTMRQYGDDILQYLEDAFGEIPLPTKIESWDGLAVFYVSTAVEVWANGFEVVDDNDEEENSDVSASR